MKYWKLSFWVVVFDIVATTEWPTFNGWELLRHFLSHVAGERFISISSDATYSNYGSIQQITSNLFNNVVYIAELACTTFFPWVRWGCSFVQNELGHYRLREQRRLTGHNGLFAVILTRVLNKCINSFCNVLRIFKFLFKWTTEVTELSDFKVVMYL